MRSKTGKSIVIASVILTFLVTFGGSAAAEKLVGQGKWQSLSGGEYIQGTWSVELARDGEHVQGTMHLTGSNVLSGGSVEGTLDGGSVLLGVSSDGSVVASFSAKLEGDSISGEWDCPAVKDRGVWYGSLSWSAGNAATAPAQ